MTSQLDNYQTLKTQSGQIFIGAGISVADMRFAGWGREATGHSREGHYGVLRYSDAARAVTAHGSFDNGPFAVADPKPAAGITRPGDPYHTAGAYGVCDYNAPCGTVRAAACHDNGCNSIADPRLPDPTQNCVAIIRALDNTWHRPFTTLELAALQNLIDPQEQLELDGLSDSAWRERIGNAVPPAAAKAIAGVIGEVLLLIWAGETFAMSATPIWVRPVVAGLMSARGII